MSAPPRPLHARPLLPRPLHARPLLALLLGLALLAGACSGGGTTDDPNDDPSEATDGTGDDEDGTADGDATTIDVTLFGGPAEIAGYQAVVDSFEAANPDVEVVLNPVAKQDDLLANLTTAFAGGQPPDVFLVNYLKYGQFAAEGVLADVQPYLDASEAISVEEFAEPPLEAFRFDGETLTCMPQNISSLEVYYNVDLFDSLGLDHPAAGWDWDDLVAAARTITREGGEGTYGIGVEASLQRLAPFVWAAGGDLVDDPLRPTTLTLDDPATREALEFFVGLQTTQGVVPPDAEEQSLAAEERFIAGQLGMYLNSRKSVPTLRESISDFTWDVAPMPAYPGGESVTILHGDAYCLSADGDPDTAWRFVEHAMTAEGQEILAASGRTVPSRLDVASSPVFLEPEEPPASSQVFVDVIPTIRSLPHTATWSQMQDQVDGILADALYGRVPLDQAVEEMTAVAEAIFALEPPE